MAITFEEKNDVGKNIMILFVLTAILAVGGFFAWNFLQESTLPVVNEAPSVAGIDMKILESFDAASLEAFPEIVPVEIIASRQNPFVEQSAAEIDSALKAAKSQF